MLLGLSGLTNGEEIDVAVVGGHGAGGVAHGTELVAFVDAVHAGDASALAAARRRLADGCGEAGLIDAAAVCANFQMMNRIADGTGTPLDEMAVAPSAALRASLGVDDYPSRRL